MSIKLEFVGKGPNKLAYFLARKENRLNLLQGVAPDCVLQLGVPSAPPNVHFHCRIPVSRRKVRLKNPQMSVLQGKTDLCRARDASGLRVT